MDNTKERLEHLREYLRRNIESLQQKVDGRTSSVNFEDDNIELSLTGRQLELLHDSLFVWLEIIENKNKTEKNYISHMHDIFHLLNYNTILWDQAFNEEDGI